MESEMRTITYPVTVHSCLLEFDIKVKSWGISPGERYLAAENDYFKQLPVKCPCKKQVTLAEAQERIKTGQAEPVYKLKHGRMEADTWMIWMAQQRQVPRIDLVSRPDIERAYLSDDPEVAEAAQFMIEEIHRMHIANRLKLIVPFRPDPTEGRLLFCFADDLRTKGGHSDSR